ncbi:MAG: nitrite/sulfite reductase [Terracidiphilus sp.]|jgi:sulfite reductase (ferredoxin)
MFYRLPDNLEKEIDDLESLIASHLRGEVDATTLKVRRVPFGCYEQRRPGTYMLRVRTTGGAITPAQLRGLAHISELFGAESLHITTRQEFQIHDVALESVIPALRALLALGLSTRGGGGNTVRNIILSEDAGIGTGEVFDPSPWAFALTSRLIAEADSWNLPRKFKIAFSNSPADSAYAQFNDVGFIATIKDGRAGFKVYVAGGLGARAAVGHLLESFVLAEDIYAVTAALKRLFDQHGNRKNRNAARLRFLWSQLGEEGFRQLYNAERELIAQSADAKLEPFVADRPQSVDYSSSVAANEGTSPEFARWRKRYVFPQRQPGLNSVVVPAELGNIANPHVIALANFLEPFGAHSVRAAFGQNLRLRNIPEAALTEVFQVVKEITELADAPLVLGNAVSCTGADTCQLGICLPKGALTATKEKLLATDLDLDSIPSFQINLSGCPNSCGQHSYADLGFYGQARHSKGHEIYPAYGVVAGGVRADGEARLATPIGTIAAHDIPEFTRDVLALWLEKNYRFKSFSEYLAAEGSVDIQSIFARFRAVPDFNVDPAYYTDWSADKPFSLLGRGQGECSAGLFDQIGIDLKRIAELRKRITSPLQPGERAEALYQIALSASHALLVTRGIEAADDESVFSNFQRHFIGGGLIDRRFYSVVDGARLREFGDPDRSEADILALADAVKSLYESLDNSLRISA